MQVSQVASSSAAASTSKQVGQLGKDDFLKLLLAQLKNQDPMNPMDDTQFVVQLAQFSTLEKIQEMDDRVAQLLMVEQMGQAKALIGKEVEARAEKTGETIKGRVDSVAMVDGGAVLSINGKSAKLSDVLSIVDRQNAELVQASALIGREVEAQLSSGQLVKGQVSSVNMVGGSVLLTIDGKTVGLSDVTSVVGGDNSQVGLASSLIGRLVEAQTGESGTVVRGLVDWVKMENGIPVLVVSGTEVKLSEVLSVSKGE